MLSAALNQIISGKSLTRKEARQLMDQLTAGEEHAEVLAALLTALRMKSETVDEIAGFVDSLRAHALQVGDVDPGAVMDVCGTGGDGSGTFNVSTTVALVVAACGQRVAKHGNRSVSSRCGSFDVLDALKIQPTKPAFVAKSLNLNRLAFLYAPDFHPVLKSFGPVRKRLSVRTVFNLLGPLLNPTHARRQIVGVYSFDVMEKMALVLKETGSIEAMIVCGHDGVDEFSLGSATEVVHLKKGSIKRSQVTSEDFGLARAPLELLRGGDAEENSRIILSVLNGERGPKRDMVIMNASAALVVAGAARDFQEGAQLAGLAIDDGRAKRVLDQLKVSDAMRGAS